jgi:hypothetical protein
MPEILLGFDSSRQAKAPLVLIRPSWPWLHAGYRWCGNRSGRTLEMDQFTGSGHVQFCRAEGIARHLPSAAKTGRHPARSSAAHNAFTPRSPRAYDPTISSALESSVFISAEVA